MSRRPSICFFIHLRVVRAACGMFETILLCKCWISFGGSIVWDYCLRNTIAGKDWFNECNNAFGWWTLSLGNLYPSSLWCNGLCWEGMLPSSIRIHELSPFLRVAIVRLLVLVVLPFEFRICSIPDTLLQLSGQSLPPSSMLDPFFALYNALMILM